MARMRPFHALLLLLLFLLCILQYLTAASLRSLYTEQDSTEEPTAPPPEEQPIPPQKKPAPFVPTALLHPFDAVSLRRPKAIKPLCLVTTWGPGKLPKYVRASLDSFAGSNKASFARLFLFVPPGGTRAARELYPEAGDRNGWPENVNVVDIGDGNERWKKGGWSQMFADQLCKAFGKGLDSVECRSLIVAARKGKRTLSSALIELRPFYGALFEQWINPGECSAWAWADLDVLWGDLSGIIDTPLFRHHSDVLTLGPPYTARLYTSGQFTAFNQLRRPDAIRNMWRICAKLRDIEAAEGFFGTDDVAVLDEGCAMDASLKSGLTITTARLQDADSNMDNLMMLRWSHGFLFSCHATINNQLSRRQCRQQMAQETIRLVRSREDLRIRRSTSSSSQRTTAASTTNASILLSPFLQKPIDAVALSIRKPTGWDDNCLPWIYDWSVQYCPVEEQQNYDDGDFWVPVIPDGRTRDAFELKYAANGKYLHRTIQIEEHEEPVLAVPPAIIVKHSSSSTTTTTTSNADAERNGDGDGEGHGENPPPPKQKMWIREVALGHFQDGKKVISYAEEFGADFANLTSLADGSGHIEIFWMDSGSTDDQKNRRMFIRYGRSDE